MAFTIVTYALAFLGALGIWAVVSGRLDRVGRVADRIEACGPFELVTRDTHSWDSYIIRYRGAPWAFHDIDGASQARPNALISFTSPTPAFLAHVGDPNNTGAYYLIREVNGAPRADLLTESHGGVSADWIDDPARGAGLRDTAIHRRRLEGGRYLLVDDTCVVDTATLWVHRFALPTDLALVSFKGSLGLSPQASSFVRLATDGDGRPCLLAICFLDGTTQVVPIDRRRMRHEQFEDLDAAWVDHHFDWRTEDDGCDRLVVRSDFLPLPYRGRLTVNTDGYREYRLPPSSPTLLDTLAAFIRSEWPSLVDASADEATQDPALPGSPDTTAVQDPGARSSSDAAIADLDATGLRIAGGAVHCGYYENHVAVYSTGSGSSRPVLLIARRFDQELAGGRHDHLFNGDAPETP